MLSSRNKFGGDFGLFTKADDSAILTRKVGREKNLTDRQLSAKIDRTVGAIRQRRYVLRKGV